MSSCSGQPLLPGFHPDPSWVRHGGYTYLVVSTFAWLPGLPLYRSRDHRHWEALPPAIPHAGALPFAHCEVDSGLYAPGLRHDGKRFLLACTLVHRHSRRFYNFICTSDDPSQGWSDPVFLPETVGQIDPTPFVEDDGSLWLVLNGPAVQGKNHGATRSIRLWELDRETFQPIRGPYLLWHGALVGAPNPEGPRLFKKDGWYWLVIAEGGTGDLHAVTMARSRRLTGPYQGCYANPLLTHRHLGRKEPVQCVGHADFVQDEDGRWHGCCLAERWKHGRRLMGRETWTFPMEWPENDWPALCPGTGKLPPESAPLNPHRPDSWLGLREAPAKLLTQRTPDAVEMPARPWSWEDTRQAPSLVAKRVTAVKGTWTVEFPAQGGPGSRGITLFAREKAWVALDESEGQIRLVGPRERQWGEAVSRSDEPLRLSLSWDSEKLRAQVGEQIVYEGKEPLDVLDRVMFTGVVAGLWARGNGGTLKAVIQNAHGVDHHPGPAD